jgi:preprotein translocase subunit SecG
MGFLGVVLLVFFVAVCALLVLMVVIQDSDSDSLGGVFSGAGSSAFGSRSSSIIVKITYTLGVLFFLVAFGLALLNRSNLGNIEAAAREKQGTTENNWFEAQPQVEAPLPSTEPSIDSPGGSALPPTTP